MHQPLPQYDEGYLSIAVSLALRAVDPNKPEIRALGRTKLECAFTLFRSEPSMNFFMVSSSLLLLVCRYWRRQLHRSRARPDRRLTARVKRSATAFVFAECCG